MEKTKTKKKNHQEANTVWRVYFNLGLHRAINWNRIEEFKVKHSIIWKKNQRKQTSFSLHQVQKANRQSCPKKKRNVQLNAIQRARYRLKLLFFLIWPSTRSDLRNPLLLESHRISIQSTHSRIKERRAHTNTSRSFFFLHRSLSTCCGSQENKITVFFFFSFFRFSVTHCRRVARARYNKTVSWSDNKPSRIS